MSLPYFPFYPKDFLADARVRRLPQPVRGAYLELLGWMWTYGGNPTHFGLPDREEELANLLGISVETWKEYRRWLCETAEPVLPIHEGRLTNPRLESIWKEAKTRHENSVEAGQRGARARWLKVIKRPPPHRK